VTANPVPNPRTRQPGPVGDDAMPHVLVVDDDRRLRTLLKQYLTENGYRVTTAVDAADARKRLEGLAFDLIVLDVMMPGESGFEFTTALRETSDVPILLLTAMGEVENRITGLESGADDYLPKPFEPRELLLRIGRILRRSSGADQTEEKKEVSFGRFRFDIPRGELWHGRVRVPLTTAEIQLLSILATSPGRIISRSALARRCGNVQERSIDVQITRLRRKFENDPKVPRFLRTVRGEGYILWTD
jgi:two-component system, OmpR family, phosphate regulon response regulator OmpR